MPGRAEAGEGCQTLLDEINQSGILQELIDGIEQIVFEQRSLFGRRGIEELGSGGRYS